MAHAPRRVRRNGAWDEVLVSHAQLAVTRFIFGARSPRFSARSHAALSPCLHLGPRQPRKDKEMGLIYGGGGKEREGNYPALVSDKYAIAEIAAVFVVGSRVGASRDPVLP